MVSSDIIRIRFEKVRKYPLFDYEYEFEYVRILTLYSNSKFKFENIRLIEIIRLLENIRLIKNIRLFEIMGKIEQKGNFYTLNPVQAISVLKIQSNLCITSTLGTQNSGYCSNQGGQIKIKKSHLRKSLILAKKRIFVCIRL